MVDELITVLDPVALVVLTASAVGATELVKRIAKKDYTAALTILVSAVVAALLSPFVGVAWYYGLVVGLQASGFVTVANKIGQSKA